MSETSSRRGFARIDDTTRPVRVLQVGAGGMGRAWLRNLSANPDVELVGLVDLDVEGAASSAEQTGYAGIPIARSVSELATHVGADAVLNVTVPVAHHAVSTEALFLGLPVLSEKPAAPTVAEAMSIAAASEVTGQLMMISQSRRYYPALAAYKAGLQQLGGAEMLSTSFFKAPRFGGFRETMPYPLLVDMAIHQFDVARYLLDDEPRSVYADSYNPSWSWFDGDAAANVTFDFTSGARFNFTGSWVSDGLQTSWNGTWHASTASGSGVWDGENAPTFEARDSADAPEVAVVEAPREIAGSLAEFVSALRTGEVPSGEVHSNAGSLVMVEAAVQSAEQRRPVLIADALADARRAAIAAETRDDVRSALESSER